MDDEEIIRNMLCQALLRLGYEVKSSKDSVEAIESYIKEMKSDKPFSVVLLDLNIQGSMGGKDVIQKLIEINPDVKGIAISGYFEDTLMSDCKRYGFCAAIAKPFNTSELSAILDKVLLDNGERKVIIDDFEVLKSPNDKIH